MAVGDHRWMIGAGGLAIFHFRLPFCLTTWIIRCRYREGPGRFDLQARMLVSISRPCTVTKLLYFHQYREIMPIRTGHGIRDKGYGKPGTRSRNRLALTGTLGSGMINGNPCSSWPFHLGFSSSFVFINFSGYPVRERIEEPEVWVGGFLLPRSSDVGAPGTFPGIWRGKFSSSFVFINFSGYPVKERIEEPEVRVGAFLLPRSSDVGAPGTFPGIWRGKFSRSFVFIIIAGCTFIFESRSQELGSRI